METPPSASGPVSASTPRRAHTLVKPLTLPEIEKFIRQHYKVDPVLMKQAQSGRMAPVKPYINAIAEQYKAQKNEAAKKQHEARLVLQKQLNIHNAILMQPYFDFFKSNPGYEQSLVDLKKQNLLSGIFDNEKIITPSLSSSPYSGSSSDITMQEVIIPPYDSTYLSYTLGQLCNCNPDKGAGTIESQVYSIGNDNTYADASLVIYYAPPQGVNFLRVIPYFPVATQWFDLAGVGTTHTDGYFELTVSSYDASLGSNGAITSETREDFKFQIHYWSNGQSFGGHGFSYDFPNLHYNNIVLYDDTHQGFYVEQGRNLIIEIGSKISCDSGSFGEAMGYIWGQVPFVVVTGW